MSSKVESNEMNYKKNNNFFTEDINLLRHISTKFS